MKPSIRIATRQSPLALRQAHWVKAQIETHHPDVLVDLITFMTEGDKRLATPLNEIGGKGLFVKELERAILTNEADIAVHSLKDMPVIQPDGLEISTICRRDDPRDVLVSHQFKSFANLPNEAIVGTSSLRRSAQLKNIRPDLIMKNLRGNVNTRLKKLEEENFAAIILAAAGLKRMNLQSHISEYFSPEILVPAVGQGAIAIESRQADHEIKQYLQALEDSETRVCVTAERAMNARLNGGCQVPIAGFAILQNNQVFLRGLVASLDGKKILRAVAHGAPANAAAIGIKVAEDLLSQGASEILAFK